MSSTYHLMIQVRKMNGYLFVRADQGNSAPVLTVDADLNGSLAELTLLVDSIITALVPDSKTQMAMLMALQKFHENA